MDRRVREISEIIAADQTPPINFDASGKMSLNGSDDNFSNIHDFDSRHEMFAGSNFSRLEETNKASIRSRHSSMPDLSGVHLDASKPPIAIKGGPGGRIVSATSLVGGRVTPISVCTNSSNGGRRHTLKEFEEELDKLQRENYNLKLRIWQMEGEYDRRGLVSEGEAKKDLEGQISELTSKLEEKERMLRESMSIMNSMKSSCHRQLLDFKREHEAETDAARQQFNERMQQLEELVRSTNQQLEALQQENHRLSEMVSFGATGNASVGESDSDVSLLSQRERLIFDLKARVALLERALQDGKPDVDDDLLRTITAKGNSTLLDFENQTVNYEELETEALMNDIKQKEEIIAKFRLEVDDRDEFIGRLRSGIVAKDSEIAKMQAEFRMQNDYIKTLESNMEQKNQNIARLEDKVDDFKSRLENMGQHSRTPINNSDDEKLRQLEEELSIQRANSRKNAEIIRALMKQLHNERNKPIRDAQVGVSPGYVFDTPTNEIGGQGDFESSIGADASSMFVNWLNETAGLQIRQHDDLFRRRVAELQTVSETMHDRLKRVADNLEDYARKLCPTGTSVDSTRILSALSNDISRLRQDLHESFTNATYSIAAGLARGAAASATQENNRSLGAIHENDLSFNPSRLNEQFQEQLLAERPDASHFNLSNLSRFSAASEAADAVLPSKYVPPFAQLDKSAQTEEFAAVKKSVSVAISTSPSMDDRASSDQLRQQYEEMHQAYEQTLTDLRQKYDRDITTLRSEKDRFERYGKKIKAMYREAVKNQMRPDLDAILNDWLASEQIRAENIDRVVRQVEENNEILGDQVEQHKRHDRKLKDVVKKEAAKVKELKRQLKDVKSDGL